MDTKHINKTFTLQQGASDCGAACLKSIISYYGGNETIERLREISGTSKQGTTILGLHQAAEQLHLISKPLEAESVENLRELTQPAILHVVINEYQQHYFVFYGFEKNDRLIIGDPAKGIIHYSRSELEAVWKSKALIKLDLTEKFEKVKHTKKQKRIWIRQLIEEDKPLLVVALFFGTVISLLGLATAIFSQRLIDDFLVNGKTEKIILGLSLLALILFICALLDRIRKLVIIRQNKDFNNRLISRFYGALMYLPKLFFDTRKTGELIARMNDTSRIQSTINLIIQSLIIDILVIAVSTMAVFMYSKLIGAITLFAIPIYLFIVWRYHFRIVLSQKEVMQSHALSESNYIDSIQGIEVIKSNSKEPFFIRHTTSIYNFFQEKLIQLSKLNIGYSFWAEMAGIIIIIGIYGITCYQVLEVQLKIGEMVAILSLSGSIIPAINRSVAFNIQIQEAKIAFDRMFEFASLESEQSTEDQKSTEDFSINELSIEHLSFRFAGRKQILKDISMSVSKGQIIALLGESGCGKSTLLHIVQRFYYQESGAININGNDWTNIPTDQIRNKIGVVPQQVKLFNGTLMENICLEDPTKHLNEVVALCKTYGFEAYFNQFPQGYATLLGEEGINISGGQRQLVALARALYKKPELLLLDEATVAMDRNTSNYILDLLTQLKSEMVIVMVTHQIKTASRADMIYILEDGIISHADTPKGLLTTKNFYSESFQDLVSANNKHGYKRKYRNIYKTILE